MLPNQIAFLDKFYKFAEECDDDYEIMAICLKMVGIDQKPNHIKKNLENIGVDSCYTCKYEKKIQLVTFDIVNKARWYIQKKRNKHLTLF